MLHTNANTTQMNPLFPSLLFHSAFFSMPCPPLPHSFYSSPSPISFPILLFSSAFRSTPHPFFGFPSLLSPVMTSESYVHSASVQYTIWFSIYNSPQMPNSSMFTGMYSSNSHFHPKPLTNEVYNKQALNQGEYIEREVLPCCASVQASSRDRQAWGCVRAEPSRGVREKWTLFLKG